MKKIIPYVFIFIYYLTYPFHSANATAIRLGEKEFNELKTLSLFGFPILIGILIIVEKSLTNLGVQKTDSGYIFPKSSNSALIYLLLFIKKISIMGAVFIFIPFIAALAG